MQVEGQESKVMGAVQELNDRIVQVQNALDDEKVKRENSERSRVGSEMSP